MSPPGSDLGPNWDQIFFFEPWEFDPHADKMSEELLFLLDRARKRADTTFSISSGYRPGDGGAHGRGLAVDIRARGSANRMRIVRALLAEGFPRVGVYDKHVHADIDRDLPPGIWGGVSK